MKRRTTTPRPSRRRAATAAGALVSAAAALAVAAPVAHAETTGHVMVQTQRTSAPNLASQYTTPPIMVWWFKDQDVVLQCYVRGQSVKGYYSAYYPGGWDNLWYRTQSGLSLIHI